MARSTKNSTLRFLIESSGFINISKRRGNDYTLSLEFRLLDRMVHLPVEGMDEIEKIITQTHSEELIELVKSSCAKLGEGETSFASNPGFGEVYECKDTYQAALVSAAATVTAVKAILDSETPYEKGYCIVRPPGHHAYHNKAAGFCFFNNVALAVNVARAAPFNLKRIAIFDWDIHHGDGTQSLFYETNEVLFISLHRTDKLTFYPGYEECRP